MKKDVILLVSKENAACYAMTGRIRSSASFVELLKPNNPGQSGISIHLDQIDDAIDFLIKAKLTLEGK